MDVGLEEEGQRTAAAATASVAMAATAAEGAAAGSMPAAVATTW